MRVEYTFDVVGYGECRIRTAGIDEPFPAADEDLIHVVAFFFTTAIRFREFEAIRAAAHFRDHVWGRPVRLYGDQRDTQVLDDLEREMDRIIRGRLLVVEQVAPVVAPKQTMPRPKASSSPAAPVAPPPVTEELPVHFELCFLDEFGDPIPGLSSMIRLRHDGVQWTLAPDGGGTIRLDRPYGASTAWARLADQDAVDALRDAVKPLWDHSKRVQDRKDSIITEEGEETSIVYFRSAPPPKERRPAQQIPLLTRDFRLVTDEPHRVSVQPYVELARLIGFYFDTNKCFLLPTAVPSLQAVVGVYERNRGCSLLIVGHTDTSGEETYNELLSLERAEAMAAYLHDRVDDWIAWYGNDKAYAKRWGVYEDSQMMVSFARRGLELGANPVLSYQEWHNALPEGEARAKNWEQLDEDGIIGPKTRSQLVGDYMNHDRTTLDPDVEVTPHGCGEYFPLDIGGVDLDVAPADGAYEQADRRVEIFFFDGELGVQPPPTAAVSPRDSPEYPEWRSRVRRRHNFIERLDFDVHAARLPGFFSQGRTFQKPAAFACLREVAQLLQDNVLRQLLIVGHADAAGSDVTNIALSENRALTVKALLTRDCEYFRARFDSPDPVAKWGWEELQWMLSVIEIADSPCYAGRVDGSRGQETVTALEAFQLLSEIPLNHLCDEQTLTAIIRAFVGLIEPGPVSPDRIRVVGAGSRSLPRPFGSLPDDYTPPEPDGIGDPAEDPENRRVELFVSSAPLLPPPEECTPGALGPAHDAWCDAVTKELTVSQKHDVSVRLLDPFGSALCNHSIALVGEVDSASGSTDHAGVFRTSLEPGQYSVQTNYDGEAYSLPLGVSHDQLGGTVVQIPTGQDYDPIPASEPGGHAGGSGSTTPDPTVLLMGSSVFVDGESLPREYSRTGGNVSPPLDWSPPPPGTVSQAIIVDDPDASSGAFVHWIVTDLSPSVCELEEGAGRSGGLPGGARHGRNDFRQARYDGPAPPSGTHRYVFRLYALDIELDLAEPTGTEVEKAMTGHVLATATLTGTFSAAR